jgi:hypothetical protein
MINMFGGQAYWEIVHIRAQYFGNDYTEKKAPSKKFYLPCPDHPLRGRHIYPARRESFAL